ncbi:MAG: YIP1 family protein [Gemmatimonadetes bacterium]|nr:YIP1 family protein [Gemmatimonadota bacterium]
MTEPTSQGADADLSTSTASPTAASPASASVWEDFIDIFYAPSAVFARRRGFILPMLVVVIGAGALYLLNSAVWAPVMDAEMARAFAKRPELTPEQIEAARKIGSTMNKIGVVFFLPFVLFLTGLALWVVGKFFDAKETLGQALMVASYANIPRIVEGVVTSIQGLLLDPSHFTGRWRVSIGVGRFLDPDTTSPALLALLGRVDVFTIWVTVLLVIGLSVTGKIPRSRAAIAGVIVWFLGAVPLLLQAR